MLEVLAVIAIVVYVIGRQLLGESLRGKRVVLLPAILTIVGLTRLGGSGHHVHALDVACLVAGGVIAAAIGAGQGAVMRLEHRDGGLWGRMPVSGLLLWVALVCSRLAMTVLASALGAHVAASTAPIVLMLGVNRLGQAAVITRRALASGIPFAREKDGSVFLSDQLSGLGARLSGGRDPRAYRPDDRQAPYAPYGGSAAYDERYDRDGHDDRYDRDRYDRQEPYDRQGRQEPYDRGRGNGPRYDDDRRDRGDGFRTGRGPVGGGQGGPLDGLGAALRDLRGARRDRRSPRRYR